MIVKDFERDLNTLLKRLSKDSHENTMEKLEELRDRLLHLREQNLVKINHSVMEMIGAKHLILKGYEVDVEHTLDGLSCDLYGVKKGETTIVEIETGFIPPENALEPQTYLEARISSKIARYSSHADRFGLGTPPHYIMPIPPVFTKPLQERRLEELNAIKELCDRYYKCPPVTPNEINKTNLHVIYIIDVDEATVQEVSPETYAQTNL